MIEVRSAKKVETAGKERLGAMDGLRQSAASIPMRKIGMAMVALFGLVAYIKTLLGGAEVAAQPAPPPAALAEDAAAPIPEMSNSSADNNSRMSYGNAELFDAAPFDDEKGAAKLPPQSAAPFSGLSSGGSGAQPAGFDIPAFRPAPQDGAPGQPVIPPGPGQTGGGGSGGGGAPTGPGPKDGDQTEPPDTDPGEGSPDETPVVDAGPCGADEDAPCSADVDCDMHAPDNGATDGAPCGDDAPGCDLVAECGAGPGCDPVAAPDPDCVDDPLDAGRKVTFGTDAADTLIGDGADSLIYAAEGDDTVAGGAGDDLLVGAGGDDILKGEAGADRIVGGTGADTLDGGSGDDILTGGAGDDVLWDGTGSDRLFGDAGNDTIHLADDTSADTIHGGAGDDLLDLTAGGRPAHVDLAAGTITRPDAAPDRFDGIEAFVAGDGAEIFDFSGFSRPGTSPAPQTVFQIRNFGHDDTLVLADGLRLALSDLQAVTGQRDLAGDMSDFEARISVYDPETAAQTHAQVYGRPGLRHEGEDASMIRQIGLRYEHDAGHTDIDLWVAGALDQKPTYDLTP